MLRKFHTYAILLLFILSVRACKDFYKFYRDFDGVYAEVIKNVELQPVIRLEVHMSFAAYVENSHHGKIILLNKEVYHDLQNHRDLRYKVILPVQNPLPSIVGIYFNGRPICTGPPAVGDAISTIKLFHTFTLRYIAPHIYNKMPTTNVVPTQYYTPISTIAYMQTERSTQPPLTNPTPPVYVPPRIVQTINTASIECGTAAVDGEGYGTGFIIGGIEAKRAQFPWLSAFYDTTEGFICGGTLVSKNCIVTSAHCVLNKNSRKQRKPENSIFYMGKHELKSLTEIGYLSSRVRQFFVNPEWNPFSADYRGDIALATLIEGVQFTNKIRPLCIWRSTQNHFDIIGQQGLIAGWGITEKGLVSDVPKFVSLPVVDDSTCLRSNPIFGKITSDANFCVGNRGGTGPCQGDSGGAFMVRSTDNKFYLRGLVSAGITDYGTCNEKEYTVFTDAAKYSDWILSFTQQYG